jgi:hypothetical protein
MITVQTLTSTELCKKAIKATSFVADSPNGIRVMYEKSGDKYLFIMQKGTGRTKEEPVLIDYAAFCNGLRTCCKEKWSMQIYQTRKVITWK